MYKFKTFYFKRFYLSLRATNHWFDLLPRVTLHLEKLSRFMIISWLIFQIEIDLRWMKMDEESYNGD